MGGIHNLRRCRERQGFHPNWELNQRSPVWGPAIYYVIALPTDWSEGVFLKHILRSSWKHWFVKNSAILLSWRPIILISNYSSIPPSRYPDTLLSRYSTIPIACYSDTPLSRYPAIPVPYFPHSPLSWCSAIQRLGQLIIWLSRHPAPLRLATCYSGINLLELSYRWKVDWYSRLWFLQKTWTGQ